MKIKEIPILKEKVLDMLPVMQTEVWKNLGIGHRDGSRLISIMLDEHLIKRRKHKATYLLEKGENKDEIPKKVDFSILLSKEGKFSPCCGCENICNPHKCTLMEKWLL